MLGISSASFTMGQQKFFEKKIETRSTGATHLQLYNTHTQRTTVVRKIAAILQAGNRVNLLCLQRKIDASL